MDNGKRRIVDATLEDLVLYLQERGFIQVTGSPDAPIKGYQGLAEFLDMSFNTIRAYCRQGVFDSAMMKVGNNVRFDREKVIEIVRNKRNNRGA